jgi:hypothetical protein
MSLPIWESGAILRRLERLERENRWLKRGGLCVAVIAAVILLTGSQDQAKKSMQGERFSVMDARGKERAYLGMGVTGPVLRFLDENGDERSGLEMSRTGIVLRLLDARGDVQTGLSLEPLGVAIVSYDSTGRPLVGPNALKSDSGALTPSRRRGAGR